jgi:chemotaxis-related protein WspD
LDRPSDQAPLRCWQETGVFGDGTCPELGHLGHCRHCEVYTAAGRRHLDREIPPGMREEWTILMAREKERAAADAMSVIVFRLRSEWFALKTIHFQEATEPAAPHSLPGRTGSVFTGIVNVNGELLLSFSAANLLDLTGPTPEAADGPGAKPAATVYPRLVVVVWKRTRLVFPVEEVLGVHHIGTDDLQALPATLSKSAQAFTMGFFHLGEKTVGLLDEEKFLPSLARSLTV